MPATEPRSCGPRGQGAGSALTHGSCAMHHLVSEGEIPTHLNEPITRLIELTGPTSAIEARLVGRMAIAFWKGERAERVEVAILDSAVRNEPETPPADDGDAPIPRYPGGFDPDDPPRDEPGPQLAVTACGGAAACGRATDLRPAR